MRQLLFYTVLAIFAATAIVTLLGITGYLSVEPTILKGLVGTLLLESAAAAVGLFKATDFFSLDNEKSTREALNRRIETLQSDLSLASNKADNLEEKNNTLEERLRASVALEKRIWAALNSADQVTLETVYRLVGTQSGSERNEVQAIVGQFLQEGRIKPSGNSGYYSVAKSTPRNGEEPTKQKYSLLIGPPENLRDLDITLISWDGDGCFLLSGDLKEKISLIRSKVGPTFRVNLPQAILDKIKEEVIALELKDRKGNRWEVRSFYLYENLVPLSLVESRSKIIEDYGEDN
jgi:hypothetical protein